MSIKNRLLLVSLGVVIFLILTPFLVLFARGFKIDFKNRQVVKTGSLVITSQPSRATVYINDEKKSKRTPTTVRFLLPGDYNIRLEKDGYQSWTKRLSVRAQLVTWANSDREFITLFYKNPQAVEQIGAQDYSISSDKSQIAVAENGSMFLVSTHNFDQKRIGDFKHPQLLSKSVWNNPDRLREVLNELGENQTLAGLDAATKIQIADQFAGVLSGNNLNVLRDDQIIFNAPNVSDFALSDNDLWIVDASGLKKINLLSKAVEAIPLGQLNNPTLLPTPGGLYVIANSSLYRLSDLNLEKIYEGVDSAYWDDHGKRLVFSSKNEILLYNPQELITALIHRSVSPISNPIHNSHTGYVFFANEGKTKAIEIDGRDHRNIYTIADGENSVFSRDGKFLYQFEPEKINVFKIR